MKRLLMVLILVSLVMTGCSSAGLQEAEKNTRLTGMVPGGGIIYLPTWAASTIAGSPEVELTEDDKARIAENVKKARAKLSECIEWPGQVVGDLDLKVDYACPADPNWNEIQAEIQSDHPQQREAIHTAVATTKAAD